MAKLDKKYRLVIDTNDNGSVEIELPFTVDFQIVRNTLSSANHASFNIYNLGEKTRNRLLKNRFDGSIFRQLVFYSGYGDEMHIAFSGNITEANSFKEGTEYVTTIECYDGGFAYKNAVLNREYPKNTTKLQIVKDSIQELKKYGIEAGSIGQIDGEIGRANSFSGSAVVILQELTNGNFFIEKQKAYAISNDEAVSEPIRLITAASGLLNSPRREQSFIEVELLYSPELSVGQIVVLAAGTIKNYNGQFKIVGIAHNGTISSTVTSRATTRVSLFYGVGSFKVVQGV